MSGIFDQVINYAPPSLLLGTVTYKGTWSAATNTPTLLNPPSSITNGNYYVVSAAGTQFSLSFNIGDWIISNGSAWEKVDNTDAVSSVFGRMGAVVGVSTDYSSVGITATAVGASSPSTGAFTTLSSTSTTTLNSTTIPASKTLVVTTDKISVLAATTSAELAGVISDETGSGALVFATSPTITTPVIAQINDASGNETLKLASIASAVNEVTIENAATGSAVHISASGGDASVGLHLAGKGASGYVNVQDSTDATKRIMFNAAGGTTNTRTMLSSTQTVDRTLSLPDATDTLVGRATTDTLTNKTITGGILNGTLGAITPSTIAATTISATTSISVINASGQANSTLDATSADAVLRYKIGGVEKATIRVNNADQNLIFEVGASERAKVTSTGLNSTAIGATTPSTGAFTTVGATGDITASGGNILNTSGGTIPIRFSGATTGSSVARFANTGGDTFFGVEGNATNNLIVGCTAYDTIIRGPSGIAFSANAGSNMQMRISSAGAAITGTLSATGKITGPANTVDSGLVVGAIESQTYAVNNAWVANNTYFDGSAFKFRATGYAAAIRFGTGSIALATFGTGSAGATATEATMAFFNSTGLGIGTSSPANKLHIQGSGLSQAVILDNTGSGGKRYDVLSSSSGSGYGSGSFVIEDQAVGARLLINSSGNVGIGTTSPGIMDSTSGTTRRYLTIKGNAGVGVVEVAATLADADNTGVGQYSFIDVNSTGDKRTALIYGLTSGATANNRGGQLGFYTKSDNATLIDRMWITNTGNVGIGTSSPAATTNGMSFIPAGGGTDIPQIAVAGNSASATNYPLTVYSTSAAGYKFYVTYSGVVNAVNTAISAISDIRLKENIVTLDVGLEEIMALKPRKFDWKTGKGKDIKGDRGFIAQEFEKVFPDLIDEWQDPAPEGEEPYKSVRADLLPVIVKALQELKLDNDSLRKRLAALESK